MTSDTRARGTLLGAVVAGWAGVLHVALAIFPPFLMTREADQPSWTDAPATIVAFYKGASFDAGFMTGVLLEAASFVLLLVILAKVADLLGGVDGSSRWVGWLIVGALVLEMAFGIFGYLAPYVAAVFRADHGGLSDAGYLALHDLRFAFYWLDLVVLPFWMVPLGIAIIRVRIFPSWIGWAFIVNAVALVPTLYLSVDIWDPVSGLPSIWVLALAILMIVRPERYSSGVHGQAATS
jgi:hypothetical protein